MTQEEELRQLANAFFRKLDKFHIDAIKEYVDHGESTLALEMLCDFLGDHGVVLSTFEYQEITRLGVLLDLDINDARLTYLQTLMTNH
ncbi:MafI family immunity protein [Comamonas testosteroni]|uniref:MafI family immunity protein n=1 Tax=Comamonas testosteroni TaxID=285 RepID=A0A8B4S598_COMTE|nr:MafI family immunity protein [Comamonas testosteroni]EHN63591.1 hypothetical protein CTATCC11996_21563 [Comamonas testosteroni ATCC 11996]QQN68115.1 MafI family immunity protein [Comamonas testosteroni]SUY78659.1 Uncharacterised protein [Comamonas testosteroni]